MKLAGLDTMILIYAMKRCGASDLPESHELRNRTLVLLDNLDKEKTKIIIPTVVIAEILSGIKPSEHVRALSKISEKFFISPLDVPSSVLAGELWIKHRGLPDDEQIKRRLLKVDVLVVASAKIGGAATFYSYDAGCRMLAQTAGLEARDLPTHSTDLLRYAELKRGEVSSGLEVEDEAAGPSPA